VTFLKEGGPLGTPENAVTALCFMKTELVDTSQTPQGDQDEIEADVVRGAYDQVLCSIQPTGKFWFSKGTHTQVCIRTRFKNE